MGATDIPGIAGDVATTRGAWFWPGGAVLAPLHDDGATVNGLLRREGAAHRQEDGDRIEIGGVQHEGVAGDDDAAAAAALAMDNERGRV